MYDLSTSLPRGRDLRSVANKRRRTKLRRGEMLEIYERTLPRHRQRERLRRVYQSLPEKSLAITIGDKGTQFLVQCRVRSPVEAWNRAPQKRSYISKLCLRLHCHKVPLSTLTSTLPLPFIKCRPCESIRKGGFCYFISLSCATIRIQ